MTPVDFAPDAVLFDMDGLMIESERALLQCWREASRGLGLEQLDDALWLSFVGLSDRVCADLLRERLDEAQVQALLQETQDRYDRHVDAGLPLKAGVLELLAELGRRNIPRAVVTSTRRERALQKLERIGRHIRHIKDHQPVQSIIEGGIEIESQKAGILTDVLLH